MAQRRRWEVIKVAGDRTTLHVTDQPSATPVREVDLQGWESENTVQTPREDGRKVRRKVSGRIRPSMLRGLPRHRVLEMVSPVCSAVCCGTLPAVVARWPRQILLCRALGTIRKKHEILQGVTHVNHVAKYEPLEGLIAGCEWLGRDRSLTEWTVPAPVFRKPAEEIPEGPT